MECNSIELVTLMIEQSRISEKNVSQFAHIFLNININLI